MKPQGGGQKRRPPQMGGDCLARNICPASVAILSNVAISQQSVRGLRPGQAPSSPLARRSPGPPGFDGRPSAGNEGAGTGASVIAKVLEIDRASVYRAAGNRLIRSAGKRLYC